MKRIFKIILVFISGLILWSCSEDGESARLTIRLTDAPGAYEAVNIDIEKVLVHTSETAGDENDGWVELEMAQFNDPINLLELTNGIDTLLASKEMPIGKISQVRLVLGSDNSVEVDGQQHILSTPSSQQSGLKLNVHAELTPGIIYEVLLDFDAAKSIVRTGSDKYSLKPVIRTIVEAQSGAIAGTVTPIPVGFMVYAVPADGESFGAIPNEEGQFLIQGLVPGTYTIEVRDVEQAIVKTIDRVSVELGEIKELGTIELSGQ